MTARTAFITGATGQDGAYLAEALLARGYAVHGLRRRTSADTSLRLRALLAGDAAKIALHAGDLGDPSSMARLLQTVKPDEIYHLAGQSHVHESFDAPLATADANAKGTLTVLEAIRLAGLVGRVRVFHAASSEMFGNAPESPQTEATPFAPRSPYAGAKLYAFHSVCMYREAYGLHACNGILFNHESPLRGLDFVSRKIARAAAAAALGRPGPLALGNLDAVRDWGHARDTVRGIWSMLQPADPDDFVLATGSGRTVRAFAEAAYACAGRALVWTGEGAAERGLDRATEETLVRVDPALFRPAEVDALIGDAAKARARLGWRPEIGFDALVREMVEAELDAARRVDDVRTALSA